MPSDEIGQSECDDDRVAEVVADYLRALERGSAPDRSELIARHPDLADSLREFFVHRDRMEELLDPLRNAAARVLNVRCPHCRNTVELIDDARASQIHCSSCGSNFSLVGAPSPGCLPAGSDRIGQFQLIEQVGVGQFGSVWRARDLTLERTVAIKIPRNGQLNEAETEMFLRDARLAAQLKHANIVGVHEVGRQNGTIYIASDFIHGATLKEWIASKRLTHKEAARLCIKVARALQHAHEAGVVHRDLKPGNIMMDLVGEPHIVDFGLAKRDSGEITMTVEGQILGTPAYMPPEQAAGKGHDVDCRADVYSLGVVLFEMLTGELPFRGQKQMLIVQIQNDDPPAPRRLDSTVPRGLETICLKCLRKEPSQRYPAAAALADDLQRWLDHRPILARPISRTEKLRLWCRRRPAISSLLALLVAVVVGAAWVAREVQQRERAHGLVDQLLSAEITEVHGILRELDRYRYRVLPLLQPAYVRSNETADALGHLNVGLALLRFDDENLAFDDMYERMLSATPAEFPILRDALAMRQDALCEKLWDRAHDSDFDGASRFRACCALASYDPRSDQWERIAPFIADQLVSLPPSHLGPWRATLRPISQHLHQVLLEIMRDESRWMQARNFAADSLADFWTDQPTALFSLLMDGGPQQFRVVLPYLVRHRTKFTNMLEEEIGKPRNPSAGGVEPEQAAKRQALAAIACYCTNVPALASSVLRHSSDPSARAWFIHWADRCGLDPRALISGLRHASDDSVRALLVQTLAGAGLEQIDSSTRNRLVTDLLVMYQHEPDVELHSSIEWLLRHWGQKELLNRVDSELRCTEQQWRELWSESKWRWYVNTQGHTMLVIEADELLMGASDLHPVDLLVGRSRPYDRPQHRVRIGRTFGIASKEVTRRQWQRFHSEQTRTEPKYAPNEVSPTPSSPQNHVSWYEAAAYCNWLSEQEGIAREQWAYLPDSDGEYDKGMRMAPSFPECIGYRLPTEAEWEYACRAQTVTSRFYGDADALLPHYACYSDARTRPVGSLKPNGFGLFDMLGNVSEWTQDRMHDYPDSPGDALFVDLPQGGEVGHGSRVLRGGTFESRPGRVDSADRNFYRVYKRVHCFGFRVARTIVPAGHDQAARLWAEGLQYGQQGKWREAVELMQTSVQHRPGDPHRWWYTNQVWHFLGEMDNVHANCDELIARFGETDKPSSAHIVAMANLQIPGRALTAQIERLAELSGRQGGLFRRDLGLLYLRRGNLDEAEKWFEKANSTRAPWFSRLYTLYNLALVRQMVGNTDGAKAALASADRIRAAVQESFADGDYGDYWHTWLGAEAVRRDVMMVIEGTPAE